MVSSPSRTRNEEPGRRYRRVVAPPTATRRGSAYESVFAIWAEADPAAASAALAKAGLRPADRRLALAAIARAWAMKEPRAALAWVPTRDFPAVA